MDSRVVVLLTAAFCTLPAMAASTPVDEVLQRYEEALGGRPQLDRIQSIEMFGTVEGMGLSGTTHSIQ